MSEGPAGPLPAWRWLCRLGLHRYPTWWPNIAPSAGGGPMFVLETCTRGCGHSKLTRNWR